MSYMVEIHYVPPANPTKESALLKCIAELGGRLDYREEPNGERRQNICLTYEFDDLEQAATAAERLRQQGEHVEGPQDYGP
jgi:hypothetical protein